MSAIDVENDASNQSKQFHQTLKNDEGDNRKNKKLTTDFYISLMINNNNNNNNNNFEINNTYALMFNVFQFGNLLINI
jgi:hypothetical protein